MRGSWSTPPPTSVPRSKASRRSILAACASRRSRASCSRTATSITRWVSSPCANRIRWSCMRPRLGGAGPEPGDNVGLLIGERGPDRALVYLSTVGRLTSETLSAAEGADCLFFDGTFWSEEELCELGVSEKRAREMAHLPIGGESGSLAALRGARPPLRIYIHLNNTNPVLAEDSPERAAVERAGWRVARDGLEIAL